MKIKTDKYDKRFSQLIRLRDVVCQRCGKGGRLECSHVHSRRHKAIRWDTRNAKALCFTCHQWYGANPVEASEWLKSIVGERQYDILRLIAHKATKAPDQAYMDILYGEMKEEIDYLRSVPEEKRRKLQFRNRYIG